MKKLNNNLVIVIALIVSLIIAFLCGEPRTEAEYEDAKAGCYARYGTENTNSSKCVEAVNNRFFGAH